MSATPIFSLPDAAAAAGMLTASGFDAGTARYGVDAYRLVYRTVDPFGRPTTASGLLAVPRGLDGRLRVVSFAHGTGAHKGDAPSMQQRGFLPAPAVTYASAGFAAVAPDYLGMGAGPGPHPWMDIPSETTASLDMLRAAREFAPTTGHRLDRDVMVTGFSQGASAALALGRALQSGQGHGFRLAALAPVSGAYDFSGAELPALLDGRLEPKSSVVYAAYLLVSFQRLHHIYDAPSQVFNAPYADTVEALFDSSHTGAEIMQGLPATLDQLLTPYGRELLTHPNRAFTAALRPLDQVCTNWTPRVPVRLYEAQNDEQAANTNTAHCATAMRRHGGTPETIDVGPVDYHGSRHLGSNVAATADIVRWFLALGDQRG
ncbi:alpha/beta fold hydrolase [Yinghuangia seranimata]|uniref:alpha/beta fold hydrolase n=1 Tax=Yinghuangia seranimata TaxID=408067 RepID=UPI00248BE30F|nr:alpha/beta fold hydrolase [Yinghuangia seranimata]MDI2128344.1 alpha/beta fold hydrolase [Yinghuangia seranimata]